MLNHQRVQFVITWTHFSQHYLSDDSWCIFDHPKSPNHKIHIPRTRLEKKLALPHFGEVSHAIVQGVKALHFSRLIQIDFGPIPVTCNKVIVVLSNRNHFGSSNQTRQQVQQWIVKQITSSCWISWSHFSFCHPHLSSIQNLCWLIITVDYTTQYVGGHFIVQQRDPELNQPGFNGIREGFWTLPISRYHLYIYIYTYIYIIIWCSWCAIFCSLDLYV